MSRNYVDNAYNRRLGRVGMPVGSCVVSRGGGPSTASSKSATSFRASGYSTTSPFSPTVSSCEGASGISSTSHWYVDNAKNRQLGRVGKPLGSHVEHKDGSITISSPSPGASGISSTSHLYVDNAKNRQLGRVGKPLGSHVEHKDGSITISSPSPGASGISSTSHLYVDNAKNRQLGQVGIPLGSHVEHKDGSVTIDLLPSSISSTPHLYVDNAENTELGRVGEFLGSRVERKDGSVTIDLLSPGASNISSTSNFLYVDNAENRWLGQVGNLLGSHIEHNDGLVTITSSKSSASQQQYYVDNTYNRRSHRAGLPIPSRKQYITHPDQLRPQVQYMGKEIIPYCELEELGKEPIGRGGFGHVYVGLWKKQPIAFKKLIVQHMPRKKLEMFVKEIKIFASLDNPHTVKIFGAVVEEENIGIVMEYLTGSLYRAIFCEEIEFSSDVKKIIVLQVASALEYLHDHDPKIAHCDIKSENILLDKDHNAKLGDFGLSAVKNAAEISFNNAGIPPGQGTPRYSAPEVLRGEFLSMNQLLMSDIYSLAIVVFEVLMEEEPYEDFNLLQLQEHVGRGRMRPPLNSAILTQPVIDILQRSWDVSASQRPTALEFMIEWSEILTLFNN